VTITRDAVYRKGRLHFNRPVKFAEGTAVRVTITPADEAADPLEGIIGIGSSGRADGAKNHDQYVYKKFRR